jgi:hypothetical protein
VSKNKPTPGNWQVNERRANGMVIELYVWRDGDDAAIASDIYDPDKNRPSRANAYLIAAAPVLLEVVKKGLEGISHATSCQGDPCSCGLSEWADMAREAIKKAEGKDW